MNVTGKFEQDPSMPIIVSYGIAKCTKGNKKGEILYAVI